MRKIITLLLSVLLITGLFTGCNGDAVEQLVESKIMFNNKYYRTLQEAVDAALASGETKPEIKLSDDVIDSGMTIDTDKTLVLNLNGHGYTLDSGAASRSTGQSKGIVVKGNSKLIIKSDCENTGVYLSFSESVYALTISDNAIVTFEGKCGTDAVRMADMTGKAQLNINIKDGSACKGYLKQVDSTTCTVNSGRLHLTGREVIPVGTSARLCLVNNGGKISLGYKDPLFDVTKGMGTAAKSLSASIINGFNTQDEMKNRVKRYDSNLCGKNWMGYISDDQPIRYMSLPGTHDSGTYNIPYSEAITAIIKSYATTQTFSLRGQFNNGVRVFDLRPNENLNIFHGSVYCDMDLMGCLKELLKCLSDNPTEGIIVILSKESGNINTYLDNLFRLLFRLYTWSPYLEDNELLRWGLSSDIYKASDNWSKPFIPFTYDLTMGQLRGKISFIFRDEITQSMIDKVNCSVQLENGSYNVTNVYIKSYGGGAPIRTLIKDCFGNFKPYAKFSGTPMDEAYVNYYVGGDVYDSGILFVVQDDSENTFEGSKCRRIQYVLDFSDNFIFLHSAYLFINHTSGFTNHAGPFMSYRDNANFTNRYTADALTKVKGRLGFIMMDFAGEACYNCKDVYGDDLASHVWQHNFYQDQSQYYWTE